MVNLGVGKNVEQKKGGWNGAGSMLSSISLMTFLALFGGEVSGQTQGVTNATSSMAAGTYTNPVLWTSGISPISDAVVGHPMTIGNGSAVGDTVVMGPGSSINALSAANTANFRIFDLFIDPAASVNLANVRLWNPSTTVHGGGSFGISGNITTNGPQHTLNTSKNITVGGAITTGPSHVTLDHMGGQGNLNVSGMSVSGVLTLNNWNTTVAGSVVLPSASGKLELTDSNVDLGTGGMGVSVYDSISFSNSRIYADTPGQQILLEANQVITIANNDVTSGFSNYAMVSKKLAPGQTSMITLHDTGPDNMSHQSRITFTNNSGSTYTNSVQNDSTTPNLATLPGYTPVAGIGQWNITATPGDGISLQTMGIPNPGGQEVLGWDGTTWVTIPATYSVGQRSFVMPAGITKFTVANAPMPLPIIETNLAGNVCDEGICLNWNIPQGGMQDAVVQRFNSTTNDFEYIGSGLNNNEFIDKSPIDGINVYRLMFLVDGDYIYSDPISIRSDGNNEPQGKFYPNPLSREQIQNSQFLQQFEKYEISDFCGNLVNQESLVVGEAYVFRAQMANGRRYYYSVVVSN